MNTRWKWLTDETWHWKGHVVDDTLADDIQMEMFDRSFDKGYSPTFLKVDATDEAYFDLPGMILQNRAERRIDVEGLVICIPSEDWEDVLAQVRLLPERALLAQPETKYYKLHGWRYAIVLTPAQRTSLIEQMEAQRAEAEVEGEADRRRFVEGMENLPGVYSAKAVAIKRALDGNKEAN
jgi:hypothetical protein